MGQACRDLEGQEEEAENEVQKDEAGVSISSS